MRASSLSSSFGMGLVLPRSFLLSPHSPTKRAHLLSITLLLLRHNLYIPEAFSILLTARDSGRGPGIHSLPCQTNAPRAHLSRATTPDFRLRSTSWLNLNLNLSSPHRWHACNLGVSFGRNYTMYTPGDFPGSYNYPPASWATVLASSSSSPPSIKTLSLSLSLSTIAIDICFYNRSEEFQRLGSRRHLSNTLKFVVNHPEFEDLYFEFGAPHSFRYRSAWKATLSFVVLPAQRADRAYVGHLIPLIFNHDAAGLLDDELFRDNFKARTQGEYVHFDAVIEFGVGSWELGLDWTGLDSRVLVEETLLVEVD